MPIFTVTDTSDSITDTGSLRYAISQAQNGDTIDFSLPANSTINITQTLQVNNGITIDGSNGGVGGVAISALNGTTQSAVSDFTVNGTTANPVTIQNLAINNGDATGAAGTSASGTGQTAGAGGDAAGGILVNSGSLNLVNDSFSANTATGGTGGYGFNGANAGAGGNAAGDVYVESGAIVTASNLTDSAGSATGGSAGPGFTPGAPGTGYPVSNDAAVNNAVACYCTGTLIRTARGDVAVEDLAAGDIVVTASGAHRPIRWIGRQQLDCRNHPRPHEAMPVRVREGAFGVNLPASDLWLSPGHAVRLDVLGEVLVPIGALINGATIVQEEVDSVTYWHVELDSHDILIANGMPAESYIDVGNRAFFTDGTGSPDGVALTLEDYCRPLIQDAQIIAVMRTRLLARAAAMGWSLKAIDDLDIHLVADGAIVRPDIKGTLARFVVTADVREVWLVSKTFVPALIGMNDDARHLGLQVRSIGIDDGLSPRGETDMADPSFCLGFHALETREDGSTFRWTAGRSLLQAELWEGRTGTMFLQVAFNLLPHHAWMLGDAKVRDVSRSQNASRPSLQLVHAA